MSPDIEQLLRDQLRGAATGAPQNLGVDDQDVLTRGSRVVVRRRALTVAGVAAATIAIAGTVGVLAPRVSNDTLPALPTPTVTPTPEATPTITSTASPSVTVTASPTATTAPTTTPSATATSTAKPSRTKSPSSSPSRTKTPTPKATAGVAWSDPVTVGGVSYSARVLPTMYGDRAGFKAEVRANGTLAYTRQDANGEHSTVVTSNPNVIFAPSLPAISDVVSENSQPVSGEKFGTIKVPYPDSGSMTITIIRLPRAATVDEGGNVINMVVRQTNGTELALCVGYCFPS